MVTIRPTHVNRIWAFCKAIAKGGCDLLKP
jgi:hypothetical protein